VAINRNRLAINRNRISIDENIVNNNEIIYKIKENVRIRRGSNEGK